MKTFSIFLFFFSSVASAQKPGVPRDTSFTVHSALVKEKKKYPFIELAAPAIPQNINVVKNIVYTSVSQRDLHLDVYYPSKKIKKKHPGVLLIHGGGWKSGDKSLNEAMAIVLALKGYVAVTAEYRLSPEAQFPAAVHDLKEAIKWMRANARTYKLNKKKVAVLGTSAGGQLAALIGVTNGNTFFDSRGKSTRAAIVQAIIDIDGVLAFKHPESAEGQVAAEWLGGSYEEKPGTWERHLL